jgi:hypothetical protein
MEKKFDAMSVTLAIIVLVPCILLRSKSTYSVHVEFVSSSLRHFRHPFHRAPCRA